MNEKKQTSLKVRIGRYFLNGLILLFPLLITIYALNIIVSFANNILTAPLKVFPWAPPSSVSLIVTILFIIVLGYLATNVFITRFFKLLEHILFKVPIVKQIYSTAQQINEILFLQKEKSAFRRVCLIPYPHPGVRTIGFLTNESPKSIIDASGMDLLNVLVPTTPTPATGFLVLVPRQDVILLDISIDDAFKLIVSGGVLSKHKYKTKDFSEENQNNKEG